MAVLFVEFLATSVGPLDPEDLQDAVSSWHDRARKELERFGGTLERFTGDSLLGVFGVPLAHEEDPERSSGRRSQYGRQCES